MDEQRWQRLDRLFAAAEPLPEDGRREMLDREFAHEPDAALRRELEELLAASGGADPKVDGAIAGSLALFAAGDGPPQRLGPYRILREIGRGGMATVYEAARDDREFERRVAVKVLRRGMDTADIVRRLRRERQILANLDHPNIARLLDGGSTPDGRPYVVMEHIDGEPIDQYCLSRGLDLRRRLELFRQICGAVHFAHRSLVLHRDIKPSNILVTAEGVPKLLDFGIAKILQEDDQDESGTIEMTATGLRLLTPEWASPEQVRGEPLSTASDVYSLGLVLYLLAIGERAYRVDTRRPAEIERVVCETAPKNPGRGDDLDVIILAALRKEPSRRYASAEQLGEDVRRYLENLPIAARKDNLGYRARKFVRRHRLAVAAMVAVFLTLLVAALITSHQARVAGEERRKAEENLARAEQVATFLTDIFEESDPGEARGRSLTAREVLDQGVRRMRFSLHGDPGLRADLLGTMGRVYQKLGLYDEAAALLEEAVALRAGGNQDGEVDEAAAAASQADLATLDFQRGRLDEAQRLARGALAKQRQVAAPPRELARGLKLVADIEAALDRGEEAERLYREALELAGRAAGEESEVWLALRNSLGELYYRRGEIAKARQVFEEVLAIRRRTLGADHPALATSLNNLAAAKQAQAQWSEARALLLEVLAMRRRVYGERHVEVAITLNNLATVETQAGELDGAIGRLEEAIAIHHERYGGPHPELANLLHNLGALHQMHKHAALAEQFYREALEMRRQVLSPGHPAVAQTLRNLGELFEGTAPQRAKDYFLQALEIDRRALPAGDPRIANSLSGLGRLAFRRGDAAAAEKLFREELAIRGAREDWRRFYAEAWLGRALAPGGRRGERLALLERAEPALRQALGPQHPRAAEALRFLEAARDRS